MIVAALHHAHRADNEMHYGGYGEKTYAAYVCPVLNLLARYLSAIKIG